jgi:hypothetical protein
MAKKHVRSGKPSAGGRVTPKGTRPDGTTAADTGRSAQPPAATPKTRPDLEHGRRFVAPTGPTRAGHHRGQR